MRPPLSFAFVISLLFGATLNGQNLLTNGDFETPASASSPVPAWTITGTSQIEEATEGATSGTHSAAFNIGADFQGTVLSQSFATTAGGLYRLSFDGGIFGQRSGARLQLEASVLGSGGATLANRIVFPPDAFTFDPSLVAFRHYELTFTANSSTTVVQFTDHGTGNANADTLLDTVSVAATPTPPPNLLVNGGFETGPFDTLGTVSGWNVGGNGFVADQSGEGATSPTHSAALDVAGDSQGNTLSQTFNTTAGAVYVLDFDSGVFGQPTAGPLQLQIQVLGSAPLLNQTITPPVTGPGLTDFQHYQYVFTADSAAATLRLTDIGTGNASADVIVDTVSIVPNSTPTPTPTSTPTPHPTPQAFVFHVSSSPKNINEGETSTFTISVFPTPLSPIAVNYSVSGDAVLGVDYVLSGTPNQVIIGAGETSATVVLTALRDNVQEKKDTAILNIPAGERGNNFAKVFIAKQKAPTGRGR